MLQGALERSHGRRKVFSDIIDHTAKTFPQAQQDQWQALKAFHDEYPTSNSVPNLPIITLTTPVIKSEWTMERSTPMSWSALWRRVAWPHKRLNALLQVNAIAHLCECDCVWM